MVMSRRLSGLMETKLVFLYPLARHPYVEESSSRQNHDDVDDDEDFDDAFFPETITMASAHCISWSWAVSLFSSVPGCAVFASAEKTAWTKQMLKVVALYDVAASYQRIWLFYADVFSWP